MKVEFRDEHVKPMKLTTPCLIPNQFEILRLSINSERYFPVSIDANSLPFNETDQNLDSPFSIIVKKKPGVLSYAQDPHSFRSLLIQSGVSNSGSVLKMIQSFTDDPILLAFVKYICEGRQDKKHGNDSNIMQPYGLGMGHKFETFCSSVLHECLTEGKSDVFPIFLSLWCSVLSLQDKYKASATHVWDIRLIHAFYDGMDNVHFLSKQQKRLLHPDFISILKENVDRIFLNNGFNETQVKYHRKFKASESSRTHESKLFGCFLLWNKI